MNKPAIALPFAAALLALALPAGAATVVDTGTPNGAAVGALVFDGSDWVAARVSFANAATIDAVAGHLLGGSAGETYDIALYEGGATPGAPLFATTATFGADGWNGASGLDWTVAPGSYWIEFEVNGNDTLGSTPTPTGALFDTGVAHPVQTATTPDWGFSYEAGAPSIGLRVSVVPEPTGALQVLAGMLLLTSLGVARRRR
jgi:hypothetical protein